MHKRRLGNCIAIYIAYSRILSGVGDDKVLSYSLPGAYKEQVYRNQMHPEGILENCTLLQLNLQAVVD